MRHQEEVEGAVHHFRLLDEAVVHVGALRRVSDAGVGAHLEESLSDSLVYDDQGVLREHRLLGRVEAVLLLHDLVELLELVADDLSPHGIANSVSVDEDVVWELALVVVAEGLECALEVFLENTGADDLLALLALRTCLGVVLAHVLIVGGAEANDALLALMANVDADQHRLLGDL